jgi:hypothetical protein
VSTSEYYEKDDMLTEGDGNKHTWLGRLAALYLRSLGLGWVLWMSMRR